MIKKIFKVKKGFTLIELLIYMGIFSILLAVTLQMYGSVFDLQLESQATSSVNVDGRYIAERFRYDVSRASSITIPSLIGASGSAMTIVANSQNISYGLDDGNLILENSITGTSDQLNSNETKVSNLSFLRIEGDSNGKDILQISYTLTSEANRRSGKEVVNFKTTGGLR